MPNPKPTKSRDASGKIAAKSAKTPAPPVKSHAIRETVESIVIAFVLAFLFRTFEAEAFVIPTGSMAPTLMGRHKDVDCPKCGYRYQVSASEEESEDPERRKPTDCIAGMCPMCHYVLPMRANLPEGIPEAHQGKIPEQSSYNGDRILVNKYLYTFADPSRWDVVVFKFPGDAKVNYIKRLVGLPGDSLQIYGGNIFLAKDPSAKEKTYDIVRKPPGKIFSMRQLVHDTNYDPAELEAAGWPLRWHPQPGAGPNAWKVEKTVTGKNVRQQFSVEPSTDTDSWLRYEHIVPDYDVWQRVIDAAGSGDAAKLSDSAEIRAHQVPRLITDSNPYDARLDRNELMARGPSHGLEIDFLKQGINWVGDLMVEADVNIESEKGQLLLDLVRGGRHFRCMVDPAGSQARLSIDDFPSYAPTAKISLSAPGQHRIAFSNFDDQLLLWIDGKNVAFEQPTTYDADEVFGDRRRILPKTSNADLGDLAPVGIGTHGAKLSVSRLRVWRDIYYIADSYDRHNFGGGRVTEYPDMHAIPSPIDPKTWDRFRDREHVEFELNSQQLFVMGDNSAESSDARLWASSDPTKGGAHPGGAYLERRLLIGKALCVYWPHSWNRIPGTPIPFPLFPNVADMRLVR